MAVSGVTHVEVESYNDGSTTLQITVTRVSHAARLMEVAIDPSDVPAELRQALASWLARAGA